MYDAEGPRKPASWSALARFRKATALNGFAVARLRRSWNPSPPCRSPSLFWIIFSSGGVDRAGDRSLYRPWPRTRSACRCDLAQPAWITLSLSFNVFVWWWQGADQAIDFFTGYLISSIAQRR